MILRETLLVGNGEVAGPGDNGTVTIRRCLPGALFAAGEDTCRAPSQRGPGMSLLDIGGLDQIGIHLL